MNPIEDARNERKARAILLALVKGLNDAGIKPGRSTLYKGFYVAHLIHARDRGALLSDWPVVKMERGPGVDEGKRILEALAGEGALAERTAIKGPRLGYEYEVATKADPYLSELQTEEAGSIAEACLLVRDTDSDALASWSHEFSRAWNAAKIGDELPIFADLLEDEDSRDLNERLRDTEFHLRDVFRP